VFGDVDPCGLLSTLILSMSLSPKACGPVVRGSSAPPVGRRLRSSAGETAAVGRGGPVHGRQITNADGVVGPN